MNHCNKVNNDDSPREKAAARLLEDEITNKFIRGSDTLPARDLSHFNIALLDLLDRKKDYRKAMLSIAVYSYFLRMCKVKVSSNNPQ